MNFIQNIDDARIMFWRYGLVEIPEEFHLLALNFQEVQYTSLSKYYLFTTIYIIFYIFILTLPFYNLLNLRYWNT